MKLSPGALFCAATVLATVSTVASTLPAGADARSGPVSVKPWRRRWIDRGVRRRQEDVAYLWGARGGAFGVGKTTAVARPPPTPSAPSTGLTAAQRQSNQANLFIAKLLMLLFYGSLGSVMPYLPVYYHSLGLPGEFAHDCRGP